MENFNPYENPEQQHSDQFHPYGQPPLRTIKPANSFEKASWAFAIAGLLSCLTFYGGYVFSSLAILFALLSRGNQMILSPKAKRSLFLGVTTIILTTVIFIVSLYIMLQEFGSMEGLIREYCRITGYDFETYFGNIFAY